MNDILTDARMNFASSSTRRLRTMVTALLTAAGLLLPALGAASTPPAELNSTESLLVGSWEGDLLTRCSVGTQILLQPTCSVERSLWL